MLKTVDLAARRDFQAGSLDVSPSRRQVTGPQGSVSLEPMVMKVLLLLLDARGDVVTRDELLAKAWGGVFVGDDSLNRAIALVRKVAAETAPGAFEVETIPRTGYRLTGSAVDCLPDAFHAPSPLLMRRRTLIGGSAAVALAATAGGLWWSRDRADARFDALLKSGEQAVRRQDFSSQTVTTLKQAIALRPDNATAWGLLAVVQSVLAPGEDPSQSAAAVRDAELTARRALALDPREPNALLAMFELQGASLDWFTRDQRLREVLAIDPDNVTALYELALLVSAAGLASEGWDLNERALALEPLAPEFMTRRGLKLWIAGQVPDSDKVIDQARALYPQDPWCWWVRFFTFAMTGRARSSRAMLDAEPQMIGDPGQLVLWRRSLPALERPVPQAIAAARAAATDAGRGLGFVATQAALIMCALNDVDTAYDIADALLFSRGPIVREAQDTVRGLAGDAGWRVNTQWMWTPPAANMRKDPRFLPLCDGVGLVRYWQRHGARADVLR